MNLPLKELTSQLNEPVTRLNNPMRPTTLNSKLEALKSSLVSRLTEEYAGVESRLVRQAVNEAQALAATTTVPLLFLSELAEEKVQSVATWSAHQYFLLHPAPLAQAA